MGLGLGLGLVSGQMRHHYALVGGRIELVKIACAAVTIDLVRVRVRVGLGS